jgi:hypothetical protein
MKNPNRAIALLVAVHVVAGLISAGIVDDHRPTFSTAILYGLIFSQTGLLGIWGGLGTNRWWVRLFGTLAGLLFLGGMLVWNRMDVPRSLPLASTVCVSVVLLPIRHLFAELQPVIELSNTKNKRNLQFTIRQLMLLTFIVGVVLSMGRWLHPYFSDWFDLWEMSVYVLCFATVGLTSVWAVLGNSKPLVCLIPVLLIAVALGGVEKNLSSSVSLWFWITMMISEAAFTVSSLWVVRCCGFRLVRITRVHKMPKIDEIPASSEHEGVPTSLASEESQS